MMEQLKEQNEIIKEMVPVLAIIITITYPLMYFLMRTVEMQQIRLNF